MTKDTSGYVAIMKILRQGKILNINKGNDGALVISTWDSRKKLNVSFSLDVGEIYILCERLKKFLREKVDEDETTLDVIKSPKLQYAGGYQPE